MTSRTTTLLALALAFAASSSCRTARQAGPTPLTNVNYIDIQPGWRIRVVAPLLTSGGFKPNLEQVQNQNGAIAYKLGKDFLGYETDYYSVRSINGGSETKVKFTSAEVKRTDGTRAISSHPIVPLFEFPDKVLYLRLLFLMRVSSADHNQAIVGALSSAGLDSLTQAVENDPQRNCTYDGDEFCSWVPEGVSVQVEKRSGKTWMQLSPELKTDNQQLDSPVLLQNR